MRCTTVTFAHSHRMFIECIPYHPQEIHYGLADPVVAGDDSIVFDEFEYDQTSVRRTIAVLFYLHLISIDPSGRVYIYIYMYIPHTSTAGPTSLVVLFGGRITTSPDAVVRHSSM